LKEARIDYTHDQKGVNKIPIEIDGEATLISACEHLIYKDRMTGQEVKVVLLLSKVATLPEGFKPPWLYCSGWPSSTTIWSSGTRVWRMAGSTTARRSGGGRRTSRS
jgi:hypothetical protein